MLPPFRPPAKPILVLGCPRSGTSLLLEALARSPDLRSVQSEGHILWDEFHHPRDRGWDSDALDATEGDGAAAAAELLDHRLPTAIIAANDPCAIGALDTVVRHGITVPSDISVIGYDDATFGRIPGVDLTSVRQDIPKMAKFAMTALVDRLDRPDRKPVKKTLRPKLIVRGTTAGPRERSVEFW